MIRLMIVEDESILREALSGLLSLEGDIEVVATAATVSEAIAAVDARPDVALIDLYLGGQDGLAVISKIREVGLPCSGLVLTSHPGPAQLRRSLRAGARGFLPKTAPLHELLKGIRHLYSGRRYVDSDVAAEAISVGESPLTPREGEVLAGASTGASIREIADNLVLSQGTVRNHLSNAISKLQASNRFQAAKRAQDYGWI